MAHGFNLILAALLSQSSGDECAWYFINLTFDSVVGVFVEYFLLRLLEEQARKRGWTSLEESGEYGDPPQLRRWILQLSTWCLIVVIMKFSLFGLLYAFRFPLGALGVLIFSPLKQHPTMELALVMVVAPCALNAWQFWVTDTFIMFFTGRGDNTAEVGAARIPCGCCCGSTRPRTGHSFTQIPQNFEHALRTDQMDSIQHEVLLTGSSEEDSSNYRDRDQFH